MKKLTKILSVVCLVLLSACASADYGTKVQTFLNNSLPPDFSGDVSVSHINPYFNFGIAATNVHKNDKGLWTWDSMEYTRSDLLHTTGSIKLTPRPH